MDTTELPDGNRITKPIYVGHARHFGNPFDAPPPPCATEATHDWQEQGPAPDDSSGLFTNVFQKCPKCDYSRILMMRKTSIPRSDHGQEEDCTEAR